MKWLIYQAYGNDDVKRRRAWLALTVALFLQKKKTNISRREKPALKRKEENKKRVNL